MKVYIVKETPGEPVGADDLKIITVKPEDEPAFLRDYDSKIIASGNSIQDVLIRFSELANQRPGGG